MSIRQNHGRMVVLGCLLALTAAGCNVADWAPLVTASSTYTETFAVREAPKIVIETFNGTIDASDGESDEVVLEVRKRAGGINRETAEANLDRVEVSTTQKDDTITILVRRVGPSFGSSGADVVIAVPKAARLRFKTSNGGIVCEGIQGGIDATTSNAKVEVVKGHGEIDVVTSNGPVEIEASDALIDAKTSNARLQFRGTLADKHQEFKSSNGKIEIRLAADSRFKFTAATSNSGIHCEFPFAAAGGRTRSSHLEGSVGDHPACSISAATSNGSINFRSEPPDGQ